MQAVVRGAHATRIVLGFLGLMKLSALCDRLSKETPKSSAHIVEGPVEVRSDRDGVEQLLFERLQMGQRIVGRVDLAPEGGVNKTPGGVQAPIGGVRSTKAWATPTL
jgi:hypothetical protein